MTFQIFARISPICRVVAAPQTQRTVGADPGRRKRRYRGPPLASPPCGAGAGEQRADERTRPSTGQHGNPNWSQLLWYQSTTATNLGPSKTLVTVVGVRSGPCNPVRRMRAARSCFCLIYAVTLICAEHCASREAGHGRTVAGFAPPCSSTWYKAKMVCTRAAACGRSATTVHMCAPPSGQGSGNLQPEALVSNDAVLSSNDGVVGLAAG